MSNPAAFPHPSAPFTNKAGMINQSWLQLLLALWVRTGSGTGSSGGTSVQNNFWCGAAGGPENSPILSVVGGAPDAYQDGQRFLFKAAADNTGPMVAVVTGLAALAVLKSGTIQLDERDVLSGRFYELIVANNVTQFSLSEFMPQSPQEILRQLLTVDGEGSGLDADLLDGMDASSFTGQSILAAQVFGG